MDKLENFSKEQHKIRNEWHTYLMEKQDKEIKNMSKDEEMAQVNEIQNMFANFCNQSL